MKKPLLFPIILSTGLLAALVNFLFQDAPASARQIRPILTSPAAPTLDTLPPKPVWSPAQVPQRSLTYPPVGTVSLYGNMQRPSAMVLFLSGDGGWNQNVVDMAKALAQDGQTLVVGIDIVKFYQELENTTQKCLYPAGDLENLSEFVQKTLQLPDYHKPILVGHSSGATLTYALLCQAPAGTFRGGIALGFCPELELSKPLCEGSGKLNMVRRKHGKGFDFTDQPAPAAPLELLHGELDQDCNCDATCHFFENVQNVTLIRLPKVGHGFGVQKNWMPAFQNAFVRILKATDRSTGMLIRTESGQIPVKMAVADSDIADGTLPLAITPAVADPAQPMVVFLSGDGGWTGFDQQICDQLASNHLPVVGLNSQSYFWKKKTPEETASDLAPVIRQYLANWEKSNILLVGYSFGANVAPFILNRLPSDLQSKVQHLVLLSPDPKGDFEIHVAGMLGKGGGPYDVAAELRSLPRVPVLCVSGDQEGTEMHTALSGASNIHYAKVPGSHHYNNDAVKVAATILAAK